MRKSLAVLGLVMLFAGGVIAATFAVTSGEHVACDTATAVASVPPITYSDGTSGRQGVIPGASDSETKQVCVTATDQTVTVTTTIAPPPPPPPLPNISLPIRGAFYYPWYPETWYADQHNHPALGNYNSSDLPTIDSHLDQMTTAKIGLSIASWWGQGTPTDNRISTILNETSAHGSNVKWALYYEPEGQSDPTVAQIQADLAYINSHYGQNPAFARINGKPVVFVYAQAADGCAMATRWKQANTPAADYISLKVFSGYATCADQPDNWHQYAPATRSGQHGTHEFYVSPGFWLHSSATPQLARDPAAFAAAVQNMVAATVDFKLVETFNEWGEDSSVENAVSTEWGDCYTQILHNDGAGALPASCGSAPPPPPPPPPSTCGGSVAPITKVMWILMENKDYSSIYGPAPYETQLANQCGLASNYHAVTHPSLPNYIALASGDTWGITDDNPPSLHPLDHPSIFHQAYPSAKGYDEGMPSNCAVSGGTRYAVKHNPWAYFVDGASGNQHSECLVNDVPMGSAASGNFHNDVAAGTLPNFSFVTPDLCDDMHDCSVAVGDGYLQNLIPVILAGPDYQAGRLLVVIVFDENSGTAGNQVFCALLSKKIIPGTVSSASFTHYSLLRTTEELLGVPLLANAASAPSMRAAFGL